MLFKGREFRLSVFVVFCFRVSVSSHNIQEERICYFQTSSIFCSDKYFRFVEEDSLDEIC